MTKSTDTENSLGSQAMFTKAITFKMKERAMERCISLTTRCTKATGNEVSRQALQ